MVFASTVPGTVMAEQINHNVVNGLESAGASALAGVAANHTTETAVFDGKQQSIPDSTQSSQNQSTSNALDPVAGTLPSTKQAHTDAANIAADPSAGDATEIAASAPAVEEKGHTLLSALVNGAGEGANHREVPRDGANTPDPSVDHSVNSDTDASKGDISELLKGDAHHTRTSSVKKPTTFSKVSVTKTFMAKAASPAPPIVKLGEKPSSASTSAASTPLARPRLVAKTGSGLQNMQKPRIGVERSGGPDANMVWNKNRPTPLPPAKHFTDEELKQQYGIHLATRLQTDEDGKESKWADIDDDEDDWAPEAVVWMDGTKSTVAAADAVPPEAEVKQAPPQTPAQPTNAVEAFKAANSTSKRPVELGPQKTILKPGIAAQQARQQNGGVSTSSAEKPSLKAKSPAPAPSRSPWAPLPPVDAVSPVVPPTLQTPVAHHTHAPLPTQDARAYDSHVSAPPAREIAADTFDRSWRESEGAPRELFNSANGRYEPVPENGRRGSMKPSDGYRKTAVLRRPSHGTPAEPSAAFQTRSNVQMDGNSSWNRRRGSSISQGSLPPGRRLSVSKGSDINSERRGSTTMSHDTRGSPPSTRAEPGRPTFNQQSAWDQQMPARPDAGTDAPAAEVEDPVKAQERIMKEKRAAREQEVKRRKELEEQEAAAKQERLRAKLAALEGAGKSKKEREAEAAAATIASDKTAPVTIESSSTVNARQPSTSGTAAQDATPPKHSDEPVTPPAEGEIAPLAALPQHPQTASVPERLSSETTDRQTRAQLSPRGNTRGSFAPQPSTYKNASYSSPGDRKTQPFGALNPDPFAPWGATTNGNVWGSSGIGNGTFEKASSFAPMPISQQNSALPPPPGMGRPSTSTRISPATQETRPPNVQQQVTEPLHPFPPPGVDSRAEASWGQGRAPGMSPAPGLGRQAHLPAPIGPPSRAQQQQQRADPLSAWNSTAQRLPQEYAANMQSTQQKKFAPSGPSELGPLTETFVKTSGHGASRRFDKTEVTIHDSQGSRLVSAHSPVPPNAQTQPSGLVSMGSPFNENTVRIPDGSRRVQSAVQPPIAPPAAYLPPHLALNRMANAAVQAAPPDKGDTSLPPPESFNHPVNSGDSRHPQVRLPPPPPVVKLPPQGSAMAHPQASMPHGQSHAWGPPRPIVQNADWQARFNGLFNRAPIQTEIPPSPPKTPPKVQDAALAVTSSSKAPLHDVLPQRSATVSLPSGKGLGVADIDDSADVESKPAVEPMFNDELSFGSLPKIHIPRTSNYELGMAQHNMLTMAGGSDEKLDSHSYPVLDFKEVKIFWRSPNGIFVNLPGTSLDTNKLIKHRPENRKTSAFIKKTPGKGPKGKSKVSAPNSPATASETTKKTSPLKGPTPVPSSPATPSVSVNTTRKSSVKVPRTRPAPAIVSP
ncbi:Hypothetical protein R9X50_00750000 [Acrodontium crateriforme]|uniref:Uncharacterized protein n=1 Tax=Acrodontium crateriforme TaxID=150365 RepID=A0AAQ3MBX6_9PEZI|nr:Hypothetical protein R9X50_00750000 [Acrodontium crateriforme]